MPRLCCCVAAGNAIRTNQELAAQEERDNDGSGDAERLKNCFFRCVSAWTASLQHWAAYVFGTGRVLPSGV